MEVQRELLTYGRAPRRPVMCHVTAYEMGPIGKMQPAYRYWMVSYYSGPNLDDHKTWIVPNTMTPAKAAMEEME